ncbi:LacI family DNA-binding transcriptional regulator [Kineococcus glutinatus]|uniref:LacI family DNA-binding transcriptional regulator n=1 Tax=Kineococcus glutinatus TaxID=1070872 RepID=A0ABP9I6I3_9ACTN
MTSDVGTRRPTIREVARLAGVSHETVARYLRADTRIKEASRERIGAAIAELGYRPNLVARAMRNRRTGRLALLLPAGVAISSLEMLAGATDAAGAAGYVVEVVTLGGPAGVRSERVLELADSGLFEGIVSLTPLPAGLLGAGATRTPVLVAPHYDEHMRGIGALADASCVADLVEQLAEQGHTTFLHVSGDYAHTSARNRRQVYLDTIARLGLRSYAVVDCDWDWRRAWRAVLDLPADCGVTAVVGANDKVAAGAVRGALERGWRVPQDLSVTGWDDNPLGAVMPPSITTVAVDHGRLGRAAVSDLLALLREEAPAADERPITRIIWRESTGPAPR